MDREIKFIGQILDNVHGFIPYTEAEKKIMDTLLFKRLQGIKQLSVVNWIFPGSEHTRFIHSVGVMHIADKIAVSLGLSTRERRILRLAGLLHDIGHYPLSHVGEAPYKHPMSLEELPDNDFCRKLNERVIDDIDNFNINIETTLMSKAIRRHHETIGADIVLHNEEIKGIIISECKDQDAPNIIADIITGNVEREKTNPLLVQIIHSELDADGIDYLMRDAMFAGTSFGSCEIDQLIRCLDVGEFNGAPILCIKPKGIAAADQYLINKFFSYSQVVFNKHIVISEWMAECVIDWMQKHNAIFPTGIVLEAWAKEGGNAYLSFTDNMFWSALEQILANKLSDLVPHYIKVFCRSLLQHSEPKFIKDSEVRFITTSTAEGRELLKNAGMKKENSLLEERITILSKRSMTKQTPHDAFVEEFTKKFKAMGNGEPQDVESIIADVETARLMECLAVKENDGSMHLLCDDERSLMRYMYNSTLVVLRSYEFPKET